MKRLLLIVILTFILCGCSKKEEIKEYDIKTYLELEREYKEKVEDKLECLTSTEIEEKESQIRKEIAKEVGLPYNETILLRGKIDDRYGEDFLIIIEDAESAIGVLCVFDEKQDFSWINTGDNILIQGSSENGLYFSLTNCKLVSPEK